MGLEFRSRSPKPTAQSEPFEHRMIVAKLLVRYSKKIKTYYIHIIESTVVKYQPAAYLHRDEAGWKVYFSRVKLIFKQLD